MRLLRFDFRDDLSSVDLHPLITVVSGLPSAHRRQLFGAVRRLSNGSTCGLRGLIEHQGLLVELDAGTGGPLGSVMTTATVLIYVDGLAVESGEVGLAAEIEQWRRQAAIDAVTVEEIRSDLSLAAKANVFELRRLIDPGSGIEVSSSVSPRKLMIATIRAAFEEAGAHEPEVADCDPEVLRLIDRWDGYQVLRKDAEEHLFEMAAAVERATSEVIKRTAELERATEAAKPPMLTAEQEARLETLCDAVDDSDSSFRFVKRKPQLSEAEEAERQALLGIVGAKSWTEYWFYRLSPKATDEQLAALSEAEGNLERAKAAQQEARLVQSSDPIAVQLDQQLERIRTDSQPYLGVLAPPDIGVALREQIALIDNPDWIRAINNLRDALSSNDLHPPYGLEPEELVGWTDSWLRAQDSLDQATAETEIEDQVSEVENEDSELSLAEQAAAAQRLVARHNRALSQIDRAERAAVRSAMRVRELQHQLRTRAGGPQPSTAAAVLAMVAPVAEQVLREVGGSLPVAIVGELQGLPEGEVEAMMRALEEVAQQVQVIVVTEHTGIAGWVERAGLHRASLAAGLRAQI